MSSHILQRSSHRPVREWQLGLAIGFLVLSGFGAAVDRRSTILDRSSAASRPVAPPTSQDLLREMLTHD